MCLHTSIGPPEQVNLFLYNTPSEYDSFVGGGGGGGNFWIILVRVCKPVFQNLPHSYTWPSKKRPHSYTWSSKMLTYSYTALWLVISCNTKWISSLKKYLSEKYVHIPGCQKNGAFHIGIQKNRVIHILFVEKRGPIIYLAVLKKGAIRHAHQYYAIYRKLPLHTPRPPPSPHPPPPPPPPPQYDFRVKLPQIAFFIKIYSGPLSARQLPWWTDNGPL